MGVIKDAEEKEQDEEAGAPLHIDAACFNRQPLSPFLCIKQVGRRHQGEGVKISRAERNRR